MEDRAALLATQIEEAVRAAIDDGTIDTDRVAQLIAGVSDDGQAILLWQNESWEDYDEYDADDAFAEVSNAAWLEAVDALLPGADLPSSTSERVVPRELTFADPELDHALGSLIAGQVDDLIAALRRVGEGGNLGDFAKIVGLMGMKISTSGYADLVAFYHPLGAQTIWPIRERREPDYGGIYQFGVLTDEGITMFYPEGEGDGLDPDKEPATTKTYRFADMAMYRIDDDDIVIRVKGDLHDIHFCHGHTHEEWGGPSQSDVDEALKTHFAPHTELLFDEYHAPDPGDRDRFERWAELYFSLNKTNGSSVVRNAYKQFGIDAARAFVERQPEDAEDRKGTLTSFADRLLEAGQFAESLALIETFEGKTRRNEWREELRCLLALQRYDDLLTAAERIQHDDADNEPKLAPFRALALSHLGRDGDALKLLDGVVEKKRDGFYRWARARAQFGSDPDGAETTLREALSSGSSPPLQYREMDLTGCDSLLQLIADREALVARAKQLDDEIGERATRVRPPIVDLAPSEAMLKAVTGAMGDQCFWRRGEELERDGDGSIKRIVHDGRGRAWAPLKSGGFGRIDTSEPAAPVFVSETTCAGSIEDIAIAGDHLYAADWSEGLRVYDIGGAEPREIGFARRFFSQGCGSVAVDGGLCALSTISGVGLYDVAAPTAPALAGVLGGGETRFEGVALDGSKLFVAASKTGLVTVDISEPSEPRVLAALGCDLPGEEQMFWADRVEVEHGIARVSTSGGRVWLVDVRDPSAPRSLCVVGDGSSELVQWLPVEGAAGGAHRYWVIDEDHPLVWTIDLDLEGARVIGATPIFDEDDRGVTIHYACGGTILESGELLAVSREELIPLTAQPLTPVGVAEKAAVEAAESKLFDWAVARLAAYAEENPDRPVGVVVLGTGYGSLELALDAPRTIAGVEQGPIARFDEEVEPPVTYDVPFDELSGIERDEDEESSTVREIRERVEGRAWADVFARVVGRLADHDALKHVAAGRVYLLTRTIERGRYSTIVRHVVVDDSKEWSPWRREIRAAKRKSLEELLSEYDHIDKFAEEGRQDEALRGEILEIAATGVIPALRVAWKLRDVDEDAVVDTFVRAARSPRLNPEIVGRLGHWLERPEVSGLLEELWSQPPNELEATYRGRSEEAVTIALAEVLGRGDDDRMVEMARTLLADERRYYVEQDQAVAIMRNMKERLPELLDAMREHVAGCEPRDNRLPDIYEQMFRAGHRELPEALVEQARIEKRSEQYTGVSLGIEMFDDESDHQYPQCRVERLYTGWMVAQRVLELAEGKDDDSSVFPEGLAPEPWPSSWGFLLASVLEHLGQDRWPVLVDVLCARATTEEKHAPDRALLEKLFDFFTDPGQLETMKRIGDVIRAGEAFDDKAKRKVDRVWNRTLLARGWEVLKARELGRAREIADALLAAQPEDGQVMFYDARLSWLEEDSPQAAVDKAQTYLLKLDRDPAGRGRLLNLIGCVYDEWGKVAEALPYFERAAQAHGEDPMYLANIAECHEKLGDMDQAYEWAKKALQRKAKSELCERIVREHEG